jgi:exopolysaccharide production protein ExoQ
VPSGAGFNFHNLYLNTTVELGFIGLALLIISLVSIAIRLFVSSLYTLNAAHHFAMSVFVYLMASSALEVSLMYQFQLGPVLLPLIWCYAKPSTYWQKARPLPNLTGISIP